MTQNEYSYKIGACVIGSLLWDGKRGKRNSWRNTGDLEITIRNQEDLEKAEPLILKSYEMS